MINDRVAWFKRFPYGVIDLKVRPVIEAFDACSKEFSQALGKLGEMRIMYVGPPETTSV